MSEIHGRVRLSLLVGLVALCGSAACLGAPVDLSEKLLGDYQFGSEMSGRASCPLDSNAFTASLWVCPRSRPRAYPRTGMLLTVGNGYYNGFRLTMRARDDGYVPILQIGQKNGAWSLKPADSPFLTEGRWTHIVGTWDGQRARLLVNGKEVASDACSLAYIRPAGDVLTVGMAEGGVLYFPFDFEKLSIWSRALSPAEISSLAENRPLRPPPARIVSVRDFAKDRAAIAALDQRLFPHRDAAGWKRPPVRLAPRPVASETPAVRFFVATNGDDRADGTINRPFATLKRAQDAVRALPRPLPAGGVAVYLREGKYRMQETLELTDRDAGEPGAEIVWRPWQNERVVLTGGWPVRGWRALGETDDPQVDAKARAHVVVADVKDAGFSAMMPLNKFGYAITRTAEATDLYFRGKPCTLAREPNEGWFETKAIGTPANKTVVVDCGGLERWTREPELMACGYWDFHWCELSTQVEKVDPAASTLTLNMTFVKPDHAPYFLKPKRPYFLFNALCALDRPGEWYLDRASGRLYLWAEDGACPADGDCVLSEFTKPFVSLSGVRDVRFSGLVLENGRGTAVTGTNCTRVVFSGNVIRNFGGNAVRLESCDTVSFEDNVLHTFGHAGLILRGGDRRTLTPASVRVVNNEIRDVERWRHTYSPCVDFAGVGAEIACNRLCDVPSSAIHLGGNDLLVLSNIVERAVLEPDDQGAVDIYNDPTFAGIYFGWNLWRDIGSPKPFPNASQGQAAIRFDDKISTMTVFGNQFVRCGKGNFGAVQINWGRNNVIDNNLFVDCSFGVSIYEGELPKWIRLLQQPDIVKKLHEDVDVTGDVFRKYPGVAGIETMDQWVYMVRNILTDGAPMAACAPWPTFVRTANLETEDRKVSAAEAAQIDFLPLPHESVLGPRPTDAFLRAKASDRYD